MTDVVAVRVPVLTTEQLRSIWRDDKYLRRALLIIHVGLVVFLVYSVIYIVDHPADKGSDGFEFLAAIPMIGIAVFFSLPALLLSIWIRTIRIGAMITLAAVGLNVWVWSAFLMSTGVGTEWKCITFYEFCRKRS